MRATHNRPIDPLKRTPRPKGRGAIRQPGVTYSASSSGCPNTAIHPVSQSATGPPPGTAKALNALFAANGTKTWLFAAFAATECEVPAGCSVEVVPGPTAGTVNVVTSCNTLSSFESPPPSG